MEETEIVDETSVHIGKRVARVGAAVAQCFHAKGEGITVPCFAKVNLRRPDRVRQGLSGEFREGGLWS